MGVPKFYRWMSERYPCLSEVVKDYQIPEFDNLYLDFNGVVHVCSHPEDDNPHFRITEEKIFQDIFHYIEVLFRMIRPRKVFFMAIDGVAPRAKMNQQRGRRFRSAREAEDLIRKALEAGEVLPQEKRFDSNCITPGTEFMVKLQEQLKYFISMKVSTDKMWQDVNVFLSGHETPGEGEHKVMDFIRYQKAQPGYDSNTRHCLYGLDADLIMLGLASHEPHFSLLREEVKFGVKESQKRSTAPEETTFHLLHLSLMREYLDYEFSALKTTLPFPYDLEHIIDDWVLMGFLVGNDFIPHLPHVHIHQDALPLLWKTYIEVMPTLDGYLNEHGTLNLRRFEKYMMKLSEYDVEQYAEEHADAKWLESKTAAKHVNDQLGREGQKLHRRREKHLQKFAGIPTANEFMSLMEVDPNAAANTATRAGEPGLRVLPSDEDVEEEEEVEEVSEEDDFDGDFRTHKDSYYMEKMKLEATPAMLRDQAQGYVRAVQWILYYYFNGCQSWSWYYPHHYAPFMSDVKDFANMNMTFDYGTPFLPFQQLMAVLPAASKNLLPEAYQVLMCNESSPVFDYYPQTFETDLNGKNQAWEAVVLIPFIEENRLLSAMGSVSHLMTPEEHARNVHSPHIMFRKSPVSLGTYPSPMPGAFPDIINNMAEVTLFDKHHFALEPKQLKRHLCEGAKLDVYFPGFPTLKHIKHTAILKKESVKVFQQNSRYNNMMLTICRDTEELNIEKVSNELIGRSIFVGWPHLFEAKVVKVASRDQCYWLDEANNGTGLARRPMEEEDRKAWKRDEKDISSFYRNRRGVIVGDTNALLYAKPMSGRRYICGAQGNITLEKQYLDRVEPFLRQTSVKDITVEVPSFQQYKTLEELFTVKCEVFMLGSPHYGAMGEVMTIDPKNKGRIRVEFSILQEPEFNSIWRREKYLTMEYMQSFQVARQLAISSHLVSRITGNFCITHGSKELDTNSRVNIGLNLKFNKKQEEVMGFTRKIDESWHYSVKTVQDLGKYISAFPELFDYISRRLEQDPIYDQDIFGDDCEKRMKELNAFLKELPCSKAVHIPCGSEVLDDLVVKEIEKEVDTVREQNRKRKKRLKMQVRPHLLFRPLDAQATIVPDTSVTFQLYDRVTNIRDGYSVPLGLRGTVVGIHPAEKDQDIYYAVLFDDTFPGALTVGGCANRGYRMPSYTLINATHGERREQEKSGYTCKPTAVVKPQTSQRTAEPWQQQGAPPQRNSSADGHLNDRPQAQKPSNVHQWNDRQQEQWRPTGPPQPQRNTGGGQCNNNQGRYQNNYEHKNVEIQKQNQGRPGNRSKDNKPVNKQQVDFANVWQQLQDGLKFERPADAKPDAKPSSSSQPASQVCPKELAFSGPSLHLAAQVLHVADLEATHNEKQPSSAPQSSGLQKKLDLAASQEKGKSNVAGKGDEFTKIMKSLEQPAEQTVGVERRGNAEHALTGADMQDGTTALCQMLNIGQKEASSSDAAPKVAETAQKKLSVDDLFEGAKKKGASGTFMGLAPDVTQPPPGHAADQSAQKKLRVTELLQWCQAMGMSPPTYNTNRMPDGKFTTVVTFNGLRYQGSKSKSENQACESAASHALMSQKTNQQSPSSLSFGQRSDDGPSGNFSASPNSAFTPVRPGGVPGFRPGMMDMPPTHFSVRAAFPQGPGLPYHQQGYQQQQYRPHPAQSWGQRAQPPAQPWNQAPGWGARPGWSQLQGPMQGVPQYHQAWNLNQQHFQGQGWGQAWGQQYPAPRNHGNQYVRQPTNHRDSESEQYQDRAQAPHRWNSGEGRTRKDSDNVDGMRSRKDSRSDDVTDLPPEPKTPTKNPFVPLQVEKKQKTPQREIQKGASDDSKSDTKFIRSPRGNTYEHRIQEQTPNSDKFSMQYVEQSPGASKAANVTSPGSTNFDISPNSSGCMSSPESKLGNTPTTPRARRPKSRIAANFGPK